MRKLIYLTVVIIIALFFYFLAGSAESPDSEPPVPPRPLSVVPAQPTNNDFVVDINVTSINELLDLLERAEKLVTSPKPASEPANIALMLHGPEVDFFRIDKYAEHKDIVDLAARLDAYNAVEIKMCETMMRQLGIERDNVPGFIELVPDGEQEIERLKGRGYEVL